MGKATRNTKPAKTAEKPNTDETTTAGGSPKMTTVLSAPKPDTDRVPRTDGLGKKERKGPKRDINAEDDSKDKVYGVSSRARWGGTDDLHELQQDATAAEQSAADNAGDQE